jgi:uncharacterized membrane protein (DUF106 family)
VANVLTKHNVPSYFLMCKQAVESSAILIPIMNLVMAGLQALMPPWLVILCWSALTAVVVMWIYRRCSPQKKIEEMAQHMTSLQKKMLSLQVSPEVAATATRDYLRLSLKRMGASLMPMLVSSLPALLVWMALDAFYQQTTTSPQVLAITPEWMGHWLSVFIFFSMIFSLALKIFLRIK